MTVFLFIRHAAADHVGRALVGRSPGVHLNALGRSEAEALAQRLEPAPIAAVYSSPLERALETAGPIAEAQDLEVRTADAFVEVDFGEWTGMTLEDLEQDDRWRWWNESRSTARAPAGEGMTEVLARAMGGVRSLAARHADEWVAVVSHCDVVRPLLAHFAGMPLDHVLRLEVAPASVSAVRLDPWGAQILAVNHGPNPPWPTATPGPAGDADDPGERGPPAAGAEGAKKDGHPRTERSETA